MPYPPQKEKKTFRKSWAWYLLYISFSKHFLPFFKAVYLTPTKQRLMDGKPKTKNVYGRISRTAPNQEEVTQSKQNFYPTKRFLN